MGAPALHPSVKALALLAQGFLYPRGLALHPRFYECTFLFHMGISPPKVIPKTPRGPVERP